MLELFPHYCLILLRNFLVDLAGTPNERSKKEVQTGLRPADPLAYRREQRNAESTESVLPMKHNSVADASKLNPKGAVHSPHIKPSKEFGKPFEDSGGFNNEEQSNLSLTRKSRKGSEADDLQASSQSLVDAATDPTIPTEVITVLCCALSTMPKFLY